ATQEVNPVIDRVGSGDAFMGGLIYSLIKNPQEKQLAIEFATAACCLKHTIVGDFNLASLEEITTLAGGNTSGIVSR
ncbi:MAG: sugar kinase, partial [Arenibacter sp.]|nr:sugar kinase [Arenibacter sp.]